MNSQLYDVSKIPAQIKAFAEHQKWINVGETLDEAILIGLIEYHIKVNEVEIIQSKLYESNQNNQAMIKINNFLKSSENKPNRFLYMMEQVKIQDPNGNCFKQAFQSYLKYNLTRNQDQLQFLCYTFKVQIQISEVPNVIKYYGQSSNQSNNIIILYKNNDCYYLILRQIQNYCSSCQSKLNLIKTPCQHFICFQCLSKEFESKLLLSFTCPYGKCTRDLEKEFYLKQKQFFGKYCLKCQKNFVNNPEQYCGNCAEQIKIQEQKNQKTENCDIIQNAKQTSHIQQVKDINLKQDDVKKENQNITQIKTDNQQEIKQQSKIFEQGPSSQKTQKENKNNDVLEKIQTCFRCKYQYEQNQIIQTSCFHYYCNQCAIEMSNNQKQFMCIQCGNYVQTDSIKLAIYINQEKQEDIICFICKQSFNISLLFQNKCLDFICASCLENIAQNSNRLKCKCGQNIRERDANLFLDTILNLKLEQTKQQEQQEQTDINKKKNDEEKQYTQFKESQNSSKEQKQIKQNPNLQNIQQSEIKNKLNQFEEPYDCTFCFAPFTEYNTAQILPYCNDPKHCIGVCCIVFPTECPQCYLKSLDIEKDKLRFTLPQNFENDTIVLN